ncbi:MAG: 50S ribosomal protein L30 [Bacteroidales bacterium]|jgi:large subunit ribosomal protein L30|nr:50S ribosomal protein L30 [Bacteroidales bacterium]
MKKVKITQIKSRIGYNPSQRATLDALGLHKMHHSVEHDATPQIEGMIRKVRHLVKVEYL